VLIAIKIDLSEILYLHKQGCVVSRRINAILWRYLIELPQLDTIISRILTYSQDFKSLERIVGDRLNEFEHYGYMKAYFNKGFTAKSNDFHIMYVFSTLPLEVFTPMSQRVKCPLIPSLHLSKW